jgi:hypothetical protein
MSKKSARNDPRTSGGGLRIAATRRSGTEGAFQENTRGALGRRASHILSASSVPAPSRWQRIAPRSELLDLQLSLVVLCPIRNDGRYDLMSTIPSLSGPSSNHRCSSSTHSSCFFFVSRTIRALPDSFRQARHLSIYWLMSRDAQSAAVYSVALAAAVFLAPRRASRTRSVHWDADIASGSCTHRSINSSAITSA